MCTYTKLYNAKVIGSIFNHHNDRTNQPPWHRQIAKYARQYQTCFSTVIDVSIKSESHFMYTKNTKNSSQIIVLHNFARKGGVAAVRSSEVEYGTTL